MMDKPTALRVPPFDLRPARDGDYAFAERLYVESMQPLLSRLDAWDEADVLAKFREYYNRDDVRIIAVDSRDVGFLHACKEADGVTIAQIHIEAAYRSRGIGTQVIQAVLNAARARKKPVTLSVVRHNPAQALYERLGFQIVGEDATKVHMRWQYEHSKVIDEKP